MKYLIDTIKDQLLLISQNHLELNKLFGITQNDFKSILDEQNELKSSLLALSKDHLEIIYRNKMHLHSVKSKRDELEKDIESLKEQNVGLSTSKETIELELNLFKSALAKKDEEASALKAMLHRSEELMKVTKNQLDDLERISKKDVSQSVVSQQLFKQLADKDRQLEASKRIGIKTMKQLNEAKAKIEQLKAKQLKFLDGVDDNMQMLRVRLEKGKSSPPAGSRKK